MGIKEIRDNHKRLFALGFEHLFSNQDELNQTGVAVSAGVQPGDISLILNGNELKFPGIKKQAKIAGVFDLSLYDVIEIGRKIETGETVPIAVAETTKAYQSSDPFPGYANVLKLPIRQRGIRVVELAAEQNKIAGLSISHGDRARSNALFEPLKRFWDGQITEEELYQESDAFFKGVIRKAEAELKKHGLK